MSVPESVTVAWVHPHEVAYSWFASMLELQAHLLISGRDGGYLAMRYGSGGVVAARNTVAQMMLERDVDWLFWIDTDMGFQPDTIDRLLEVADPDDRPVVGALCFVNREFAQDGAGGFVTGPVPTIYEWAQQPDGTVGFVSMADYPRDALVKCDATGSACVLIHRSVFERIGTHWYSPKVNQTTGAEIGEDLSFCLRMMEHDIPCHVHTGVKATHLKPIWLSEQHYDMWRAQADEAHGRLPTPKRLHEQNRAERRRAKRKAPA